MRTVIFRYIAAVPEPGTTAMYAGVVTELLRVEEIAEFFAFDLEAGSILLHGLAAAWKNPEPHTNVDASKVI